MVSSKLKKLLYFYLIIATTGCYLVNQAYEQNSLMNSRSPISEVVGKGEDQWLVERLRYVRDVIEFAKNNGLNTKNAYEYYVHLDRDSISYLVYAAQANSLESYTWWFPIVGEVPYLGFFDSKERDEVANDLASEGYDISKGNVGAFSSLGWFEDPIYSSMLKRGDASLAHLLFHELTHRTFWSSGSTRFNENLAEFIAGKLTEAYLLEKKEYKLLKKYQQRKDDRILYKEWLSRLKSSLVALYSSGASLEEMKRRKEEVFDSALKDLPSFSSGYENYIRRREWNNAAVLSSSLYSPDFSLFEKSYSCISADGVGEYLQMLRFAESEAGDSFSALTYLCSHKEIPR